VAKLCTMKGRRSPFIPPPILPTMFDSWQSITAVAIVALAAGYLLLRLRRLITAYRTGECGGCGTCSSNTTVDRKPLVTIDSLVEDAPKRRST